MEQGHSEVVLQEVKGLHFLQGHRPNRTLLLMSKDMAFRRCGKSMRKRPLSWLVVNPALYAAATSQRPYLKERNYWLFTPTPLAQGLGPALTLDLLNER